MRPGLVARRLRDNPVAGSVPSRRSTRRGVAAAPSPSSSQTGPSPPSAARAVDGGGATESETGCWATGTVPIRAIDCADQERRLHRFRWNMKRLEKHGPHKEEQQKDRQPESYGLRHLAVLLFFWGSGRHQRLACRWRLPIPPIEPGKTGGSNAPSTANAKCAKSARLPRPRRK